jgi:hypothetical protein
VLWWLVNDCCGRVSLAQLAQVIGLRAFFEGSALFLEARGATRAP